METDSGAVYNNIDEFRRPVFTWQILNKVTVSGFFFFSFRTSDGKDSSIPVRTFAVPIPILERILIWDVPCLAFQTLTTAFEWLLLRFLAESAVDQIRRLEIPCSLRTTRSCPAPVPSEIKWENKDNSHVS